MRRYARTYSAQKGDVCVCVRRCVSPSTSVARSALRRLIPCIVPLAPSRVCLPGEAGPRCTTETTRRSVSLVTWHYRRRRLRLHVVPTTSSLVSIPRGAVAHMGLAFA